MLVRLERCAGGSTPWNTGRVLAFGWSDRQVGHPADKRVINAARGGSLRRRLKSRHTEVTGRKQDELNQAPERRKPAQEAHWLTDRALSRRRDRHTAPVFVLTETDETLWGARSILQPVQSAIGAGGSHFLLYSVGTAGACGGEAFLKSPKEQESWSSRTN